MDLREIDKNDNTLQNEDLHIEFDFSDGGCAVIVTDRRTLHHWPAVQIAALEIYDRTLQRVNRLTRFTVVRPQMMAEGMLVTLGDQNSGITLSLSVRLTADGMVIRMSPADVHESKPVLARLFTVHVLPGLLCAGPTGEMLLPVNTGVVCKPVGKPALNDRFLIYGQQSRWELLPTMPICAVQTPGGGFAAIATNGAAETEFHVSTDGNGNGSVGLSFYLRTYDIDRIEPCIREIRFVPIPPDKDMTVFSGGLLRRHIMRDLGKPTLRQRAKESAEVAYLLNAYIMKLFYGLTLTDGPGKAQGDPPTSEFILTMTFDEAKTGLKRFADAGVDKIYTQNVGWNLNGHDGAYPTRFPIEPRVGGEMAFRDLVDFGHGLGFQMTVHDNYLDGYQVSADFDEETVARDPFGQLQVRGFWGGKPSFLRWPLAFTRQQIEGEMERIKTLGIRGPYYIDAMGAPLYSSYHPSHGGSRSDLMRGIDRLLNAARAIYGSVATETGFLYCSIIPDLVANPGGDSLLKLCQAEWPITALCDRCVPLWQLALSGLVVTENQGLSWEETMRALLYAQAPRYEWATRPGVHAVLDDVMIQKIKYRYELLIKRFGYLRMLQMTDYVRTGSVERTTFEDGTSVTADFETNLLSVNGIRIDRPSIM